MGFLEHSHCISGRLSTQFHTHLMAWPAHFDSVIKAEKKFFMSPSSSKSPIQLTSWSGLIITTQPRPGVNAVPFISMTMAFMPGLIVYKHLVVVPAVCSREWMVYLIKTQKLDSGTWCRMDCEQLNAQALSSFLRAVSAEERFWLRQACSQLLIPSES
jgi:hypothetical protein